MIWFLISIGTGITLGIGGLLGLLRILSYDVVFHGAWVPTATYTARAESVTVARHSLDSLEAARPQTADQDPLTAVLAPYRAVLQTGEREQRQYVIPTITMLVTLDRPRPNDSIVATERFVYSVHYLRDVAASQRSFDEFGHADVADEVLYLPGVDSALVTEGHEKKSKSWDIFFPTGAGTFRTVVTGSQLVYPRTLPRSRDLHYFTGLRSNEDAFCYPNVGASYVIGELTILIESSSLRFRPGGGGSDAGVLRAGNRFESASTIRASKAAGNLTRSVASARFTDVREGDIPCLRVRW